MRLMVAAAILGGCVTAAAPAQSMRSKAEIAEIVSAQRRSVQSLEVSVRQRSIAAAPGMFSGVHHYFVLDRGRCLVERTMGLGGDAFFAASAWNLDHGLSYAGKQRIAKQISAIDADVMKTKGTGFFDLMLWFPPIDHERARLDATDLLAMLADPRATIHPEPAMLGDATCHLLDVSRPDGSLAKRIWIDAARGGFPLRHEHMGANGQPAVVYESTHIMEVDGVWVPLQGFKFVPPQEHLAAGDEVLIDVEVDDAGVPLLGFNRRFGAEVFEYHDRLPTGTVVCDTDMKIIEVIGGAIGQSPAKATQPASSPAAPADAEALPDQALDQRGVPQARSAWPLSDAAPPMSDRRWLALGVVALPVVAIVVWLLARRR